jgi:hypothetical protein
MYDSGEPPLSSSPGRVDVMYSNWVRTLVALYYEVVQTANPRSLRDSTPALSGLEKWGDSIRVEVVKGVPVLVIARFCNLARGIHY